MHCSFYASCDAPTSKADYDVYACLPQAASASVAAPMMSMMSAMASESVASIITPTPSATLPGWKLEISSNLMLENLVS